MDAILLALADFWWVAPAAAAGGVGAYVGVKNTRRSRGRRLDVEASHIELKNAQGEVRDARQLAQTTKAELLVAKAAFKARQLSQSQLDGAKRAAVAARERLRQASQLVRARRAQLNAARGAYRLMPKTEEAMPLTRTIAMHDAVVVAWASYETDIDKALQYPQMTDPRHPATAEFYVALDRARWLRPESGAVTMTPARYALYRASVRELVVSFDTAERAATRRPLPGADRPPSAWANLTASVSGRSAKDWADPETWDEISRSTREAAASVSMAVSDAMARVRAAGESIRDGFNGGAGTNGKPRDPDDR